MFIEALARLNYYIKVLLLLLLYFFPVILFNGTLTFRRCDGEWYHFFYDFCCFLCVSHFISPL